MNSLMLYMNNLKTIDESYYNELQFVRKEFYYLRVTEILKAIINNIRGIDTRFTPIHEYYHWAKVPEE